MNDRKQASTNKAIEKAASAVKKGGIIGYPTESVFGLGCDPLNEAAVFKLLSLKKRPQNKGLIIIASCWRQLEHFTQPIQKDALARVQSSWPGAITWIFPASDRVPTWVRGDHASIALRVTAHPIAKKICDQCGPIVSTSANHSGQLPAKNSEHLLQLFPHQLDAYVAAAVGDLEKPTPIFDAITGKQLR